MYENEALIFVQLQKTGSTHIAKMLAEILGDPATNNGQGKHSRATQDQINSGKTILASIRNPWDWYVSLWSFGCSGKGGLRNRIMQNHPLEPGSHYKSWERMYSNRQDTGLFREWLRMIFDPRNADLIRYRRHEACIPQNVGFMTYRYGRLCWKESQKLESPNRVACLKSLLDFDLLNCYVDDFIRLERLEDDLCRVINKVRSMTQKEADRIFTAKPTNSSQRPHPLDHYYDQASIEAVQAYDALIIEKFGYKSPEITQADTICAIHSN